MNVEDLPEEMLQQVFLALGQPSHLPTVALVCRRVSVSVDYSVQRLWWGHHPIRLHRPLRHRCRTALACGLTHDVAALFGDHLIHIPAPVQMTHSRVDSYERPPTPYFTCLTGVYT
ncbi:uncharacterized protein ACA1_114490 [Acanthamoeba castellanii str. Neff]|uniref:F-box domain-containing protein n=1 Tax=Acanthamoeba castellanii (strain ATCC 30010 / Neff) TaxID=1257118 RepID=L8H4G6_ACACF|nr:uncharacterized protein ACA1_114490 [Acanthamoeba castellanii str. Neff]ELR20070.1 hypothetical protein ACA1_114490 [Acanthamoeba castellanii str. Neff]